MEGSAASPPASPTPPDVDDVEEDEADALEARLIADLQLQERAASAALSTATSAAAAGEADDDRAATASAALFGSDEDDEEGDSQQLPDGGQHDAAQLAAALRSATAAAAASEAEGPAPGSASAAAAAAGAAAGAGLSDAAALMRQDKSVLVFSTAGKPIWAYRADEAALAGLCATAEAILAVAHSKGHSLRSLRAGGHVLAFLERPPLCLVGASALGEPPAVLRMQLALVHGQIVSLLTSTALAAMFTRNPGYDARRLLAGSEGLLTSLVDSFAAAPAALLGAYPSLPLLAGVRQALLAALATAVKATGAVHGVVVAGGQVAAACPAAGTPPLQQWDVLLLLNLLGANESFRHSGEAMAPVCLPRYNSAANLHAHICYADAASQTATVLLCGGMPDPSALAAAQHRMRQQLEAIGALQALVRSAEQEQQAQQARRPHGEEQHGQQQPQALPDFSGSGNGSSGSGGSLLAVPSLPAAAGGGGLGATPLLHFVYKLSGRQQYVCSPFSAPLVAGGLQQPMMAAYSQLRAAMFGSSSGASGPLQRLRFEVRPRFVLLGAVSGEAELYLACDPLTDRSEAAGVCSRLGMWLRSRHDQLFSL